MLNSKSRQVKADTHIVSAGERFLEAQDFTRDTPKGLLLKPNGQPFTEIALGLTNNSPHQPNWLQPLEYLLREEPIGGWEALLTENKTLILDKAVTELGKRLAEPGGDISVRQFLAEVNDAAAKLKREFDDQQRQATERYAQAYARLRKWQQEYGRDKSIVNRILTLGGALVGGQVSVVEAGQLFNKRETYAKWRDAFTAAADITGKWIEIVDGYARNLDALVIAARQASAQAQQQRAQLLSELTQAHPYTYSVDYAQLAETLCGETTDPAVLAELLTTLREQGSEQLAEHALVLARREAERSIGIRNVVQIIELEGRAIEPDGAENDPVVLVGETLLDQVTWQHPTWQLTRQARPRRETVQITPDGEMLFEHPNLTTARYGERRDRLGFLDAQMDLALDELKLEREAEEGFHLARQGREYFVLEQVAAAIPILEREPIKSLAAAENPSAFAQTPSDNGRVDEPA
ncbi:MAG: hypothetical protein HY741_30005 [Chloroflexi bacterium]|nr:hypothetical protein [Chloroflexota bacterium]